MTAPGKVAALVAAAERVGHAEYCADHEGGACDCWALEVAESLSALTPEDVRRADVMPEDTDAAAYNKGHSVGYRSGYQDALRACGKGE